MNNIQAALDRVVADLDLVLSEDGVAGLPDAERMVALRTAGDAFRRVDAVVVEAVAGAEPRFPDAFGCRGMNELLQRALRVDAPGATKFGKAADAVRREVSPSSGERLPARYPALRAAMLDGVVGVAGLLAAITPLDRTQHRIGLEGRMQADAALAEYARGCRSESDGEVGVGDEDEVGPDAPPATPEDIRQFAQMIAIALDPDGPEPDDRNAQHQRFVTIGRLRDGLHAIRGNLLPDVAAQLQAIIDAQCNPKTDGPPMPGVAFQDSDDVGAGDQPFNSDPQNLIDSRTAAQKRHDALAAALGIAARHDDMPSLGGSAPTLVVHVDAKDVAAGTGWATMAGSEAPVPVSVAAQTACTGAIQRVVFDEGRIIGITVTDRVFTVHQRRAIITRDKECLIPGCHVPASWCEIHHVTEHARGGPTHTDNGVPLCWWHHRSLHWSGWEIRTVDGIPQIRGPEWWDLSRRWRTPRPRIPSELIRS